ncbi:MAG: energy-coupling factor transporter transmembrane protein EcfT, partial [Methanomicrobiales archaeon]|nr:energy-coupling factor transporter transmembrane protein EcfT [Methanomicrobiales archaeon]
MNFAFFIREIDVEKLALPGDSFLHLTDPRVKIVSLIILISGIISMSHAAIPLLLLLLCTAVSLYIGMPTNKFLKRMGSLALLGLIVSVGVLVTHGGTEVLFRVLNFPLYQEAVVSAVALLTRMLAAFAFLQLFTAVTPLIEVLDALSWFRIPRVLTNLAAMMIRSVRLLSVETVRLYYALASRGGFSQRLGYRQKMNY